MGSAINPGDIKRYEVTEVYCHPQARVDIVLVHGLNGNPRNTWTAPNGVFWPSQLLPASLKAWQARILVYGYNADVYTFGSRKGAPSSDMIHQHAQTLLANLALERKSEEVQEHPIIWVAHSLGGILVKRALELSFDLQGNHDDDLRSIFVSTFGVIFLGTPHTGADPAKWGLMLQGMVSALVPKKLFETHSQLIKTLQSNNEILQNINLRFLDIYPNRLRICMVHEGHPTDLKGTKQLIVDQAAASPQLPDVQYFGIEATHSGMCKFDSKNAPGFTNVSVTIRSWAQECPDFIQTRWEAERMLRRQKREDEIAQLQRLSGLLPGTPQMSSPNTPDPDSVYSSMIIARSTISIAPVEPEPDALYFVKPSGFRPNSHFVGREAELEQMHKILFDKKKRADGTSAVLLQSLPGGGKTHLARQYVYNHKDDFPGGIFWLRAKSETELAAGFWDIARKVALKHLVGPEEAGSLEDPEQFIEMVRKWLENRHDWLMVLDGIQFTDSAALWKFIPDSTDTSLIYTSTQKSVMGDHHYMNPQLIKLPLLSAREAQRALLLELGRMEPFAKDDLRYSMELVQSMGFLPVVIHAVAQRLKATDEPLSKFARHYSAEPKLRGLGTYRAVVDQLRAQGAKEALNLVSILCFFSQHIPVEMVSLGLKVLHVPVKAYEPVSGNSLNNTFKILNTFALIDRNEHETEIHSSLSSKGSRDMLADNVDVIRLHSVVQGFFADTLHADGSLLVWLDRAVRLFCCSYDMASERISRKPNAGLVEDYRLYEIHGIRIKEHVTKHLSKRLSREQQQIMEEADELLGVRLRAIKVEIDRKTPESSHVIVRGKPEQFQCSIFDRSSSSSDTGPETPGMSDGLRLGISTWGMETSKDQHESPSSLTHETDYTRYLNATRRALFPLLMPEDPGYDSDREELVAMTTQPSPRAAFVDRGTSERPWEEGRTKRLRRVERLPLRRKAKNSELSRSRDAAEAYRAMSAIDPRVSRDYAQGYLQGSPPRAHPKARLSGQSGAEFSLAHISWKSPPLARGGSMTQGRRTPSLKPVDRSHLTSGLSSYAAAVAGPTRDTISGLRELVQPTEPVVSETESMASLERPHSSAVESLQRFPLTPIIMPPYPPSPPIAYAPHDQHLVALAPSYQHHLLLGSEPFPAIVYPRLEGLPPMESPSSSPRTAQARAASQRDRETHSESMPASIALSRSHTSETNLHLHILSLSSPSIPAQRPRSTSTGARAGAYFPGRQEFANWEAGGGMRASPCREMGLGIQASR
ncbi:LipA and NB-ARC domain-containing protein [Diplocarpon rosae]|nr:LipA and NB-ARC domain-containing protein [Diplocarpon rosae]